MIASRLRTWQAGMTPVRGRPRDQTVEKMRKRQFNNPPGRFAETEPRGQIAFEADSDAFSYCGRDGDQTRSGFGDRADHADDGV